MRNYLLLSAFSGVFACTSFAQAPRYIGAGGCASSNCHGAASRLSENQSRIWGNEYAIWSVPDKHSKAYKALENPRSKRMAEILNISNPAVDKRCTSCHVVGSPERSASDGVSCEACHGPAEKWLGPHTQKHSHAASISAGMIDTKDALIRARTCLGCHLGTQERIVDHELIAAGHPDLAFELDTFTFAQPAHHSDPKAASGNELPHVRLWAVGEAVKLGEGMRVLLARAQRSWPEFSELECYQCHHDLRLESWRIARGYGGRKPGSLQYAVSRSDVLRVLVAQAAAEQRGALESALSNLATAVATRPFDASAVSQAAQSVAQQADSIAARFAKADFNSEAAHGLIQALATNINRIAGNGVLSAEQATMALDSLLASLANEGNKSVESVTQLYAYLEHPSTYQPNEFVGLFRKAASTAGATRATK